jgi:hypothetical protein
MHNVSLSLPPKTEVLRALSAVSRSAVHVLSSQEGTVEDGNVSFKVKWDGLENKGDSDDPITSSGRVGYPLISFLMVQGVLPYEPVLAGKCRDFDWKKIRDSEVAFDELTKNWTGAERDRALKFTSWILAMLSELEIEKTSTHK